MNLGSVPQCLDKPGFASEAWAPDNRSRALQVANRDDLLPELARTMIVVKMSVTALMDQDAGSLEETQQAPHDKGFESARSFPVPACQGSEWPECKAQTNSEPFAVCGLAKRMQRQREDERHRGMHTEMKCGHLCKAKKTKRDKERQTGRQADKKKRHRTRSFTPTCFAKPRAPLTPNFEAALAIPEPRNPQCWAANKR